MSDTFNIGPEEELTAFELGFEQGIDANIYMPQEGDSLYVTYTDEVDFHLRRGETVAEMVASSDRAQWDKALEALRMVVATAHPGAAVSVDLADNSTDEEVFVEFSAAYGPDDMDSCIDFINYMINVSDPGTFGVRYLYSEAEELL